MPRKPKTETAVVAYKALNPDFTCRDHKFEVGKTYEVTGKIRACENGFHACENPWDVLGYYELVDANGAMARFAKVTLAGEIGREGNKIFGGKITVEAELGLPGFVKAGIDWLITATKGKSVLSDNGGDSARIGSSGYYARIGSSGYSARIGSSGYSARIGSSGDSARIGSSGYYAQIGSSGYYARIGSSGDYAQIGSSGYSAQIGSSGYYAQIGSSGNSARIGSSGDSAQIGSSGYSARIGSSGDYAQIVATGANATVACANGSETVTVGENGAFCIPYHDGKRTRFLTGYAGEDGIEVGKAYRVRDGKLVEVA